jgi:hypothetical protein
MTRNIGFILLAIYLFLVAVTALVPAVVIPIMVHGIVALLAGIFILLGR